MAHAACVAYDCPMNTLTTAILWAIDLATLVASAWAFIHCLRTRPDAFPAIGRQSKGLWLALTGGATLVSLAWFNPIGILGIASIVIASVYLLDIRPKIAEILSGR
jgi:Protein of unknown function (DUF2516)